MPDEQKKALDSLGFVWEPLLVVGTAAAAKGGEEQEYFSAIKEERNKFDNQADGEAQKKPAAATTITKVVTEGQSADV